MGRRGVFNSILLLSFLFLINCKKDKGPDPITTENRQYISKFGIDQIFSITNNTLQTQGCFARVRLYSYDPPAKGPSPTEISSLFINSKSLNLDRSYYTTSDDSISQNLQPPFIWQVNGSNSYPSFSETIYDSFPRFTKYHLLPDSISINNFNTIQLAFANAQNASIYIDHKQVHSPYERDGIFDILATNSAATSITFDYNADMGPATTSSIVITCSRSFTKTIDNKTINYSLQSSYKKKIYFKN
jgi:hypothetical protein